MFELRGRQNRLEVIRLKQLVNRIAIEYVFRGLRSLCCGQLEAAPFLKAWQRNRVIAISKRRVSYFRMG